MIPVRNTLLIYFGIWLVCAALAASGTLWFWPDGLMPVEIAADGTVTKSGSVAILWFFPAFFGVMYGGLAIAALIRARRWRDKTGQLSEDAQRALIRFVRTFRIYMIGFGMLAIFLQAFNMARALGVVAPLGLDRDSAVRAFFFIGGLLFAYAGNVIPRRPYVQNPRIDAARHYRVSRFTGWVMVMGGLAFSLNALIAPFDWLRLTGGLLLGAMILLPLAHSVWAHIAYRRQKRWEAREGLIWDEREGAS